MSRGSANSSARRTLGVVMAALSVSLLASPDVDAAPSPVDCLIPGIDDRCEKWETQYDDPDFYSSADLVTLWTSNDVVQHLATAPGRVFSIGLSHDTALDRTGRWTIAAHSAASGDLLWTASKPWQGPSGACGRLRCFPRMIAIGVSPDGKRVYMTGSVQPNERGGDQYPLRNTDTVVVAYNALTGQKIWETIYKTMPVGHRSGATYDLHGEDTPTALAVSPTGDRVYVTGYSDAAKGYLNAFAASFDATDGKQAWASTWDTSTPAAPHVVDQPAQLAADVSPDGKRLIFASSSCPPPSFDACEYQLLAYQARDAENPSGDGSLLWKRAIGSGPNPDIYAGDLLGSNPTSGPPSSIEFAPDNSRVYVAGHRSGTPAANMTAAFDPTSGEELWSKTLGGTRPSAISVGPKDGRLFVLAGSSVHSLEGGTGTTAWSATPGSTLMAVGVSPAGNRVYATGSFLGSNVLAEPRQQTFGIDAATGTKLWTAWYDLNTDQELPRTLVVGADGTVFVGTNMVRIAEGLSQGNAPTRNRSNWAVEAYEP